MKMMQRNDDTLSTRDLATANETTTGAVSGRKLDAQNREGRPGGQVPVEDDQTAMPVRDDRTGGGDPPADAQEEAAAEGSRAPSAENQRETARSDAAEPEAVNASRPSSGDAPAADADVQAEVTEPLLAAEQSADFQLRWEQVQTRFVDEPRGAVEDADELVANLMQQLAAGFAQAREGLEAHWGRGEEISTEDLRVALKRYRSFFQRLLST
jgi:hypothetical protein